MQVAELAPEQEQSAPLDWTNETIESLVEAPVCYGVVFAIKYVKEIDHAPLHRTAKKLEEPYLRSRVSHGDVLISIKGTIGRVGVVPLNFNGNISRELARIRVKKGMCPEYVAYQLEAGATQRRIFNSVVGTTRLEFSIATLRKFEIPVPPTEDEQRVIAEALSDVDELLEVLDRMLTKKRDLKQAAMQQLLTGQTRLPGFKGEWEEKRLGGCTHIRTGSRNNEDKTDDGAFPFFVRSETVEQINSFSYDCEAILVPGEGKIGEISHYINGKFDVHQRVYAITKFEKNVSGCFVYYYMSKHFGKWAMHNTVKATVDSLRLPTFQTFLMRVPPTLDEQTAIAEVLSDMDAEIAALERRREKTQDLKQGMMKELLTGKTRLV